MSEERLLLRQGAIKLQDALQLAGWVFTGGGAKRVVQNGQVTVNGSVETRRSRMLRAGDQIAMEGRQVLLVDDDRRAP